MPPARRQLRALGSLQLVGYANNPTRVITELAFIADKQVNAVAEGGQSDVDAPLEVQFEDFMDGVNSRGKGTKTRQRRMTVEQAAAVLLVVVQKGHCELIAKKNDHHIIDVIKILPEAKRILAAFLPKLRGYGDIPYDQQYRGAIALAKRHFFPKGKAPTKKELMELLLQSYQEKRELVLRCQKQTRSTKTLSIQTSLKTIDSSSQSGTSGGGGDPCVHPVACANTVEIPTNSQGSLDNDTMVDLEPVHVATGVDSDVGNDDNRDLAPNFELEPAQLAARTPVVPRSFNPYVTPISNPRHVNCTATTLLLDASPTRATNVVPDRDSATDESVGELLQATATTHGKLNYYYNQFITACQRITFLEGQKAAIQKEFNLTKKRLDETEERLREVDTDRSKLQKWVDKLRRQVDSFCGQFNALRGMMDTGTMDDKESE